MNKKLPGVFANKNIGDLKNNNNVYCSYEDRSPQKDSSARTSLIGQNVNQKINTIFKSSNYIYKADVVINLEKGTVTKRIIGKNGTSLITSENELIPISSIIDIDYQNKNQE